MVIIMDKLGKIKRENIGFEKEKNSFKNLEKKLFNEFKDFSKSPISLIKKYFKYKKEYKQIPINKPKNCIKIGIVGELYSIMEP